MNVRSACDSERPTTVTHGQSWSLDGCGHNRTESAFALFRALETSPKLVVRGRVELPTFRFSGRATSGIRSSGRSDCSRRASSSLLDCLGRVRRVKAEPYAVASRALTRRPRPEGQQLSRRTGEDQDAAISGGRTAVRRAISGPLTPVTSGLSRSLADTPPRRSGHVTGPDGAASQADSAGSIPVTRSTIKGQVGSSSAEGSGLTSRRVYQVSRQVPERRASSTPSAQLADGGRKRPAAPPVGTKGRRARCVPDRRSACG